MATKCTIIGNNETIELHPIIFMKFLNVIYHKWEVNMPLNCFPNKWKNIELIAKDYMDNMDLMFAYDNKRSHGMLVLGYWNDGFVKTLENEAI